MAGAAQQDDELLAAQATGNIRLGNARFQRRADFSQHRIARLSLMTLK
jgi:hypothetical protein